MNSRVFSILLFLLSGFSLFSTAQSATGKNKKSKNHDVSQQEELNNKVDYDSTIDHSRLMLLDAMLELNDALEAGVKASLDSLNSPVVGLANDKHTALLIIKKAKEQELLLPYLQHVQDSLTEDSRIIVAERKEILMRLNPLDILQEEIAPAETKMENLVIKNDTFNRIETDTMRQFPELKSGIAIRKIPGNKTDTWKHAHAVVDTAALARYELNEMQPTEARDQSSKRESDTVSHIKANFFLARAKKAVELKQYSRASDLLGKSLDLWNRNYSAIVCLADVDAETGSYTKALKGYDRAMKIDSTQASLFFKIGMAHLNLKKKYEAFENFSRAIGIDSQYVLAYMERADISSGWLKYESAVEDYNAVIKINTNYYQAYRLRGIAYLMLRNFASASDDFTRYIIFDPSDSSVYYYRGLAKVGNNDWLEGCMDLSTAADMGHVAAKKALKENCDL
ncbi:MAG: hypothetical protein IPP77_14600 [Bacteroidetes bacterium]|nr:hypothetical protein [Bacteroidota bacterium]